MSNWRDTPCIEWGGGRNGRQGYVHRQAWEDANGPIPPGLLVCHRCDNPPCYNVEHLFLGTYKDNNQDAASKGRNAKQQLTHCPRGHELAGANLTPARLRKGHRLCRRRLRREQVRVWQECARCARVGYRDYVPCPDDPAKVICSGAKMCARRARVVRPLEAAA